MSNLSIASPGIAIRRHTAALNPASTWCALVSSPAAACDRIARRHHVSMADVRSANRRRNVHAARVEVIRLLSNRGWSASRIGRWIGRDHSTILYHLREGGT